MQEQFISTLKEYGLKVTPQRVTILDSIDKQGHASIEEIYTDVKVLHPSISLATIYKNVSSLVKKDLLRELALTNTKSKYEISKTPHSHTICKICGHVEDVELSNILKENCNTLADSSSFILEDIELNIYGICSKCR